MKETLSEILFKCSDEEYVKYQNDLANIIYEMSKHRIPEDICRIQAENRLDSIKSNFSSRYFTLEEVAQNVIWAYEQ